MRLLKNKRVIIWLFGLIGAGVVILVSVLSFAPLNRLDTLVFDRYQAAKPRQWSGSDVVILDIDEASIERFGQWPWPRSVLAEMTNKLGELGATVVVFDIVFSEPDRTSPAKAIDRLRAAGVTVSQPDSVSIFDNDALLAKAFSRNTVVAGMVLGGAIQPAAAPKVGTAYSSANAPIQSVRKATALTNLQILDDAADGLGDFGFGTANNKDAVVRTTSLLQGFDGQYYPSIALETLRVVQGAGGFAIKTSDGSGELDTGEPAVVSIRTGAIEVPTDAYGSMTIYHSPSQQKPVIPFHAVFNPQEASMSPEALSEAIANHIVIIGTSAAGLLDLRATPVEAVVAGVNIHADIIDQIISGSFLSRADSSIGVERTLALVCVLLLLVAMTFLSSGFAPFIGGALIAACTYGFWLQFVHNQSLFSPVIPTLSIIAAFLSATAANLLITERQGRFVRNAFGRYLSPEMVRQLSENPETLQLGGEEKTLTLLFCDIRGFTSLSEGLKPTALTHMLNNFLTPMTAVLLKRGATIDKYMGDAIMAFWNAPIGQKDHAQRACESLLEMRTTLLRINAKSTQPISIGIGLNSGSCCVGNLGSHQRFNYSAIGDAVNVASRIEGLTKQYGLDNLVAEETLNHTNGLANLEIDRVAVKGRVGALTVHTLLGNKETKNGLDFTALARAHSAMMDAYFSGDAEAGLSALAEATRLAPLVKEARLMTVYAIYADRFHTMREKGIPENWDGVFKATSK